MAVPPTHSGAFWAAVNGAAQSGGAVQALPVAARASNTACGEDRFAALAARHVRSLPGAVGVPLEWSSAEHQRSVAAIDAYLGSSRCRPLAVSAVSLLQLGRSVPVMTDTSPSSAAGPWRLGALDDGARAAWMSTLLLGAADVAAAQRHAMAAMVRNLPACTVWSAAVAQEATRVASSADYFMFADSVRAVLHVHSFDSRRGTAATPACANSGPTSSGDLPVARGAGGAVCVWTAAARPRTVTSMVFAEHAGLLVAPLFFVANDAAHAAALFDAMWRRFWCHFHTPLPGAADGMAVAVQALEARLQHEDAELVAHAQRLGCDLVLIGVRWFLAGFAGALPASQVLALWDIILQLRNAARPLAHVAACVMVSRRAAALDANTLSDLEAVFADLGDVDVEEVCCTSGDA